MAKKAAQTMVASERNDGQPAPARALKPPPRRLRVVVFTMVFPNRRQPLHGTFVLERARHLAALADIEVVAPVPWYRSLGHQGRSPDVTPILAVSHPRFWYVPRVLGAVRGFCLFLSTVGEIGRLRRRFDFDLIDAHFAYPDGFAAVLLGRWFRRPVCITLRGTIVQWSRRPVGRRLCDWALRRAERVIAVSHNLAERARQGGVPENRVATIANGVDSNRFQLLDRIAARARLGLPEDERLLVSVGHISPRKGFQRVIRSLSRLDSIIPGARLAIVGGSGAEEDNSAQLRALVQQLGLTDRVLFVGAQVPDRVALWLGAADVFVLASDFEGCPNVVLEAMACGRPVVATKVGDIERMVPPFAGILVADPEDEVALSDSIAAALTRNWDTHRIRDHVAVQSWGGVAERVAAQWRLAVDTPGAKGADTAGGPAAFTQDLVTAAARSFDP
ncbi:MAG TPA: glycosyltransferase [Stellaceae bacterium]|nr:glycosyltransferase [Stellaceae bacterium]